MFCAQCGSEVDESMKFCFRCKSSEVLKTKPTQKSISVEVPLYAGFWVRVLAISLDSILAFTIIVLLAIVGIFILNALHVKDEKHIYTILGFGGIFCVIAYYLYIIIFTTQYGATLGKQVLGLRVVPLNGGNLGWRSVFLREIVGKFLSGITYVGYMMAGWTEKKQALHDMVADTCVIYERNIKIRSVIVTIAVLLVFFVFSLIVLDIAGETLPPLKSAQKTGEVNQKEEKVHSILLQLSEDINKDTPVNVNRTTQLLSTSVSGGTIVYQLQYLIPEGTTVRTVDIQKQKIIDMNCNTPEARKILDAGATMKHRYYDGAGNFIDEVSFQSKDCATD